MPHQGLIFRILVASPMDCVQERKAVPEIIYSWNAANSLRSTAILEPVLWETHATPAMGDRPQALINKQLVQQCDLLIGTFWTRLGTDTGVAESGTAEEIEEFRKAGKPVLLYFSSVPVVPESIDHEQYQKLVTYKKAMQVEGLVFSYDSVGTFRELLQRHLASTIGDLLALHGKPSDPTRAPEESDDRRTITMFKSQFESFLRRFEADWTAERDTQPSGIDDGKYILQAASSEILSFMSQIVKDEGQGIATTLQDALKSLKELARHELWIDGGISYRGFWEKGNVILENLKKIPGILENTIHINDPDLFAELNKAILEREIAVLLDNRPIIPLKDRSSLSKEKIEKHEPLFSQIVEKIMLYPSPNNRYQLIAEISQNHPHFSDAASFLESSMKKLFSDPNFINVYRISPSSKNFRRDWSLIVVCSGQPFESIVTGKDHWILFKRRPT